MKKILIANRGEIAVRIIRACHELGLQTVAIYSEGDKDALHTQIADEAYCVGPTQSKDSYLNIPNILSIATSTGCDGVHPGYGFLAENGDFAELCEACQLQFIGPSYESIQKMGIKDIAKEEMKKANVPVVPGSEGLIKSIDDAKKVASDIGYPVIIKATAGGGGKGIRVARNEKELENGYKMTQQEAETAFGNGGLYLEKFIENFRHIEIQIIGDKHGNVIHLGERDCTIQRRMQKLVEEAPSPILSEEKREEMGNAAVRAAKAVNYENAGTIEFIFDLDSNNFYFMEMNTRIQVEHPVTEMVTGIDLVKLQLKVAMGEAIPFTQEDVTINGHAMEFRINAENPYKNFMPSPGKITQYLTPGGFGVRIESACYTNYTIPPYYDSMVAKLIVHQPTREETIMSAIRALEEFVVLGIDTTIPFHIRLLNNDIFRSGEFNTKFLEEHNIMDTDESN
ncbi:acetyl-CoA carboxylase biotin carboxylase subunit [Staphylococcus kloosii]|jgi:acetyl-CoA carboxylase biotin carboxylase subunit|uniref:Biotin carboxylase n=1 Tax=Staphylococcus kloosii TaxID=29384 RepID=A0A921KWR4_9STAP|nr:acetyl-CoA carboxylase biotin carboxylase subunit [Staphylococcus kloosii]AVQ36122.1 acetyl-CoA carboxylase biotin carboxylase subunit [Staphylococcus kloosii]MBF7022022.1 acetyl-CoA carboxylase biotin carboxylase subunit [Staphylococcus kloosii]MBF7029400.1 acetyl-CoA carboxylase biotin carboxylase subunit [Staphylococcus kloosii]MCD8878710.1 acetyl-CoA carboxylase biotin carboxylase subunit [Staphylococcus kloosii]PNZ02761.1 acetyl-CoA carboxylase biotin carboxylase subunit [Staphylococcu